MDLHWQWMKLECRYYNTRHIIRQFFVRLWWQSWFKQEHLKLKRLRGEMIIRCFQAAIRNCYGDGDKRQCALAVEYDIDSQAYDVQPVKHMGCPSGIMPGGLHREDMMLSFISYWNGLAGNLQPGKVF